jgi:hypothetical protein
LKRERQKNNNKIRQNEKTNSSFNSPFPPPLSNPFSPQTVAIAIAIAIAIAVHPNNRWRGMWPALSKPQQPAAAAAAAVSLDDPANVWLWLHANHAIGHFAQPRGSTIRKEHAAFR